MVNALRNHVLAPMLDRLCNKREVLSSAIVVDGQSLKLKGAQACGHYANKKLSDNKHHIAVGTDGRLLATKLTPAASIDSTDAQMVMDSAGFLDVTMKIVQRLPGKPGFAVQPRRRVVKRKFACMMRYRLLAQTYE